MNGVQRQEQVCMIQQTTGQDHFSEPEHYQIPMPDQNLLHSVTENRIRPNSLDRIKTEFISGFYGYCFGNAVSLFGDPERDGLKVIGGIVLSVMSSIYVYKLGKAALENESGIDRSCLSIAKHSCIFGVLAASGCIATWHNFC